MRACFRQFWDDTKSRDMMSFFDVQPRNKFFFYEYHHISSFTAITK